MFSGNLKYFYLLLIVVLLSGCAQQQQTVQLEVKDMVVFKSDFATGLNAGVEYVTDTEKTFITVTIENIRQLFLDIWISQAYSAEGLETIHRRRLCKTDDIFTKITIRADKLEKGVVESVKFQLYDENGKVLFVTTPIYSDDSDKINKSETELFGMYQ
ncbi:hypothetical protein DRQ25_10595 [Candidatus Fermentibacteria bacterium]|nr:MAG: hypothetical protein DRQ25_10595 [Candidatus Fermentibacteria bacterium]